MTIINPDNTEHDFNVLARTHVADSYKVTLTDEAQRLVFEHNGVVGVVSNGRLTFTLSQVVRPEAFYYMKVEASNGLTVGDYATADYALADYSIFSPAEESDEIYRGKIYTTTQTELEKFKAVTRYVTPTQKENDFIVYP